MKKITIIALLFLICTATAYAIPQPGGPHLWLSTDPSTFDEGGAGYVYDSLDPWFTDSYVTSNPFRLYLYNSLNNENAEEAIDVGLILAIHSGEEGIVTIKDEFGNLTQVSEFTYINVNPYYGGGYHGVYQPAGDAVFALYQTGIDLASNESTYFDVSISGTHPVHIDAFSTNGFYNPASHDVTVTPEPASLSLLGLGLFGLFGLKRRRKE